MNLREITVIGWNKNLENPDNINLGIANRTQRYVGNITVNAEFEIEEVLEEYTKSVSYLGRIALAEPKHHEDKLQATLYLSKIKEAAGYGVIKFEAPNQLLSRLDFLERLVNTGNSNL